MIVYIAGPYTSKTAWGVERNVRRAEEAALEVARAGHTPLCPHSMFRFFDGTLDASTWYRITMDLMCLCDAIVLVGAWKDSIGACTERDAALTTGMKVFEEIHLSMEANGGPWVLP